jgi:hypothetical protein
MKSSGYYLPEIQMGKGMLVGAKTAAAAAGGLCLWVINRKTGTH